MTELPAQAHVVVIGGGAVGASVLYHLALRGLTDAVLIEKAELTSGSTWHAAGNTPSFSGSLNVMKLQAYSNRLYDRLGAAVDYPITRHKTGSVRLAQTADRAREFHHVASMAGTAGIGMAMLSPAEARDRHHPLLVPAGLEAVLWDPEDGDIDPAQLTQALAKGARDLGAKVVRFTEVTGIARRGADWLVTTDKGRIAAGIIVNAAGYYADRIGRMLGRDVPMAVMSHQYLITEAIPGLPEGGARLPLLRDPDDSYYLRQEGQGLLLGPYEWDARAMWTDGSRPADFAFQLWGDDLDRLSRHIDAAMARVPALAGGGVKRVVNGPIPYAPDGMPLLGPCPGVPGAFEACVFTFGIAQAGGAGRAMAEWILDGGTADDLWMLDPRRFGDWATRRFTAAKAVETYQNEYAMALPWREWPAGRPAWSSPLYDRWTARGAQWGFRGGWERALWFAKPGDRTGPDLTHGRPYFFDRVGEEVRAVTERAGLMDLPGFARFEVAGPGAAAWLDGLIAGSLPREGAVSLAYFCAPSGKVWTEMTVTRWPGGRFWLIGAAAAREHDRDWLTAHLPADGSVTLADLTMRMGTLILSGPSSRDILGRASDEDVSGNALPWLRAMPVTIGAARGFVLRVGYTGEMSYELHMPVETLAGVHDRLTEAAGGVLPLYGLYAMDSMRLEKGYRGWKGDLSSEFSPLASGMDRFVKLGKPAFPGRDALQREAAEGPPTRFCVIVLDPADGTEAPYGAIVRAGGEAVGLVTSGGHGHRTGRSIAFAYVRPDHAKPGCRLSIDIFGEARPGMVVPEIIFDPENRRLRA
jgi:dimethylglycine dehydrogenase